MKVEPLHDVAEVGALGARASPGMSRLIADSALWNSPCVSCCASEAQLPSASMRIGIVFSILALISCDSTMPAPTPTSATPVTSGSMVTTPSTFAISGTVYESSPSGLRPLAGVPLDISVEYQSHSPQTTTDADGRYSVTRSASDPLTVKVEKTGYSQPCVARTSTGTDSVLDIFVVRESVLREGGLPASFPIITPTLSGVVFESPDNGQKAIAGARVTADYSGGMGWGPAATTMTDHAGRYLFCGLQPAWISIWVSDGKGLFEVPLKTAVSSLDIEVPRRER